MSASPTFPSSDGSQKTPRRFRVHWKWSIVIATLLLILLMWQCGSALIGGRSLADAAVKRFHQQLNNQQYGQIYSEAHPALATGKGQEDLARLLEAMSAKLGEVRSETFGTMNVQATTNGTFITVQYNTEFASGPALETFTWMKDGDKLKLYGYNIRSNAFLD